MASPHHHAGLANVRMTGMRPSYHAQERAASELGSALVGSALLSEELFLRLSDSPSHRWRIGAWSLSPVAADRLRGVGTGPARSIRLRVTL